jgi:hypothetical protein
MDFQECVAYAKRNAHKKYIKADRCSDGEWEVIGRNMAWNCSPVMEVFGPENNWAAPLLQDASNNTFIS